MYSKKQIADAVVKFINTDLMTDSDIASDKHLKFTLCMAKKALHSNPDVMDAFLESPIIANVIKESDGEYDIDVFVRAMKNVLSEYESYSIVIPKIPMFAPKESVLKITADDVDKIISYLKPETSEVVS